MRRPDYDRRVVVTGLGVISPVGNDKDTAWRNLTSGVSGLDFITHFDTTPYEAKFAGEVHDFSAARLDGPEGRPPERVVACTSGSPRRSRRWPTPGFELTDENRTEVGVIFGSGAGGQQLMIDNYVDPPGTRAARPSPRRSSPTRCRQHVGDDRHRDRARSATTCASCRPARPARTTSARRPRRSVAATASRSSPARPRRRSSRSATPASRTCAGWACRAPASRSRPFRGRSTLTRDGFVLGEGAASLFLEDLELAKARGAQIYAEVVGYGSAADGWDMVQPIDAGVGSARAMQMALERRGVPADEVDLINPHGTSTPLGDKREAEAIHTVFGARAARDARSLAISGDEVDDRPHDGRRRRVRGVRDGHVGRRAMRAGDPQLPRRRPRLRRVGRAETHAACRSATPSRTTSGSAATTAPSSSSATTGTDGSLRRQPRPVRG